MTTEEIKKAANECSNHLYPGTDIVKMLSVERLRLGTDAAFMAGFSFCNKYWEEKIKGKQYKL